MMKIILGPKRFSDMLRKALINSKGIEEISGVISPSGISFSDISKGVLGTRCDFNRNYFEHGYEVDEEYETIFTKDLLDGFTNLKFGSEDKVQVVIDKEKECFHITGGTKSWDPKFKEFKLQQEDESRVNYNQCENRIGFGLTESPGIGFLTTDVREGKQPIAQFSIGAQKLDVPDVEKATIRVGDDKTITTELDYSGPFSEILTPAQVRVMTAGAWTVFVEMMKNILGNFSGDLWVTIYTQAIFFTKTEEDYSLMYIMAVT